MKKLGILGLSAGLLLMAVNAFAGSMYSRTATVEAATTATVLFRARGARTSFVIINPHATSDVYFATFAATTIGNLMRIPAGFTFSDSGRNDVYVGDVYIMTQDGIGNVVVEGTEVWWKE